MKAKITALKPFGLLIEALDSEDDLQGLDVEHLRALVWQERLIALRGFRLFECTEHFVDYCARWGEISEWPFGKVLELVEHPNPEDHIFDHNYVPLHWDGMYRQQVPELQLFRCVSAPGTDQGGRTTFSNTVSAIAHAPAEAVALWRRAIGHYQRKMAFYNSKTVSPILDIHPLRGFEVLRYNEPPSDAHGHFLNPPLLQFTGIEPEEVQALHDSLKEALYGSESFYAHAWCTGDLVVADNFTLLHGREAFPSQAPRALQRVHVLSTPPLNNPRLVAYS